jgi:iron complex outermembrane receptor protein
MKGSLVDGKVDFTLALFDIEKKGPADLDPRPQHRGAHQPANRRPDLAGSGGGSGVVSGGRWRLEANVAYTDAAFEDFNENLGTGVISRKGKRPSNVPEWVANVFVSKRFANGLTLSGGPRHVSDRFSNTNNSVVAEAYTTVDLSVSYPWKRWSFTLRGRNLLDEEYEPVAGTTMRRLADPISAEFSARVQF